MLQVAGAGSLRSAHPDDPFPSECVPVCHTLSSRVALRSRRVSTGPVSHLGPVTKDQLGLYNPNLPLSCSPSLLVVLSERAASLPELTPAQRNKLRHLSIISLASNLKCLPYSLLLQQLELKNVRELEDLLIEAVYCDIIQGKLDQRNQQVEVDCSVGRDLGPNELPNIANTLQEWCSGCEAVLCGIEEQVSRANLYRESQLKVKVQVETEVSNLQKTLKASSASPSSGPAAAGAASNQDADQPAEPRDPASSQEPRQPGKKSSKVKGLRGSGKIWSKSN
uniref:PCI domain-containing protein n=1 Tax=Esox lucius TaxID=8010 RepID=A0AAY5K9B0_ESOLU